MVQIKELGEGSSHAGQVVIRGLPSELSYGNLLLYTLVNETTSYSVK
jgi:hypothetical protein